MAAALSTVPMAATLAAGTTRSSRRSPNMTCVAGLNAFSGLKAQNSVTTLGRPVCSQQAFANIVNNSLRMSMRGRRSGRGSLTITCSAVEEIFRIAAIMNGLTLVGVAVGFVLLRIEAIVEEE